MGAVTSCSVAVGLIDEEKEEAGGGGGGGEQGKALSNSKAARVVRQALSGGLVHQQILRHWSKHHDLGPMTPPQIKGVLESLVEDYPNLARKAFDLAFDAYSAAEEKAPNWQTVKQKAEAELGPLWNEITNRHAKQSAADREQMIKSQLDLMKLAPNQQMTLDEFSKSFRSDIGPAIANHYTQERFPNLRVDDIGRKYEKSLLVSK
jgi:hypothetical protein